MTRTFLQKKILILYCSTFDPNLTHRASTSIYGSSYLRAGIQPVFLDIAEKGSTETALHLAKDPDVIAIHCEQGWGLDLQLPNSDMSLFDILDKPVVTHIRDHPFCPWLLPKITAAPRRAILAFTDGDAVEYCKAAGLAETKTLLFEPHIYLPINLGHVEETKTPMRDRDFKFLYAGTYQPPEDARSAYLKNYNDFSQAFDALVETALHSDGVALWQQGQEIATDLNVFESLTAPSFTNLLFQANQFIRHEKRRVLLKRFAKFPMHLIWRGPLPEFSFHPDTTVAEPTNFVELNQLLQRSRAMVMSLNNFQASLSERLLNAMLHSVSVWCSPTPFMKKHFEHNKDFIDYSDESMTDDQISDLLHNTAYLDEISNNAQPKAMKFSPDQHITRMIDAIEKV
ncbi:MAG: hypothetical protein RIC29_14005 [Rhodospirillaceae bacterium]